MIYLDGATPKTGKDQDQGGWNCDECRRLSHLAHRKWLRFKVGTFQKLSQRPKRLRIDPKNFFCRVFPAWTRTWSRFAQGQNGFSGPGEKGMDLISARKLGSSRDQDPRPARTALPVLRCQRTTRSANAERTKVHRASARLLVKNTV